MHCMLLRTACHKLLYALHRLMTDYVCCTCLAAVLEAGFSCKQWRCVAQQPVLRLHVVVNQLLASSCRANDTVGVSDVQAWLGY